MRNASEGIVVVGGGESLPIHLGSGEILLILGNIGAVGIEMAAELKHIYPEQKITLIHSRARLLSSEDLPDDFAERALEILREENIEVILGQRVVETTAVDSGKSRVWRLTLADGKQVTTGLVLSAISRSVPTSTYLSSDALNEEGLIKIHPS